MKSKSRFFSGSVVLTEGSPLAKILAFSVPLLLGNILQQLYNTVDSIVVGNFVGSGALAAVGASGPIINLMISFFLGLSAGTSVLVSQAYGGKRWKELSRVTGTVTALMVLIAAAVTAAGLLLTPALLRLLQTPAEIFDAAAAYMRITFGGIVFLMLYNVFTGILQGAGDSFTPFLFLLISCLLNILLDLVFVAVLQWGVAGAAWATLIAQAVSVAFGFYRINHGHAGLSLNRANFRIDRPVLVKILRLGLPIGFQNALSSIGNLIVQALLNGFGPVVIAANTAVIKVDSFCTMPMSTFGTAVTVFVAQNLEAGGRSRIKAGVRSTLAVSCTLSAAISAFLFFFGSWPLRLFTGEEAVVAAGMDKFRIVAPFYIMMALFNIYSGVVRGCGKTFVPMLVSILSMFFGRVPTAWLLSSILEANGIHWSLSVCWTLEALAMGIYYYLGRWNRENGKPPLPGAEPRHSP